MELNRATLRDRCRNAIAGVKKDLTNLTTVRLDGVDYTPASLMTLFQSFIDLADAAVTARQPRSSPRSTPARPPSFPPP